MAGPPNASFMQATCVFTGPGLPRGAVATFGLSTPISLPILETARDLFVDFHENVASASVTLAEVRFKYGPDATGPTFILPAAAAGLGAADMEAPQVAFLIRKVASNVSGRYNGRAFWPGLTSAAVVTGGLLATATFNAVNLNLETLHDGLADNGMEPVIFSIESSDPRPVESFVVSPRCATQRRRNRSS